MIRKLDQNDVDLLREAYSWQDDMPKFFVPMLMEGKDSQSWDDYLAASNQMIEFGVFAPEFCGLISLYPCGNNRLSAHIAAKRGADSEKLALAAFTVRDWLFKNGAKEIFAWVWARHTSIKKLCTLAGLKADTVTMIRGEMRGKLLHWQRFSARAI